SLVDGIEQGPHNVTRWWVLDVLRQLRQDGNQVPVLILSTLRHVPVQWWEVDQCKERTCCSVRLPLSSAS
ncbi:hypothetical protein, partial [Achromobacter xylosoxidans]|uniref:hypothetical protein n=1 Tax=Alcaligenes xylosoxydans xylosoxydans TaxID=85698 RepID=UPI003D00D610